MSSRYLLRESHAGRIAPRPDMGLYASRHAAKKAARSMGLPVGLITRVRRMGHE
jgi:hypothetical protein